MADASLSLAGPPQAQYCICRQDDSGIMIECIRGTGGCNGWVHPACCGLVHTQAELEAMANFVCPMCERADDDYAALRAVNAAMANRSVKKERRDALAKAKAKAQSKKGSKSKSKGSKTKAMAKAAAWRCPSCGEENTAGVCAACGVDQGDETEDDGAAAKKRKKHHHHHKHKHEDKDKEKTRDKAKDKSKDRAKTKEGTAATDGDLALAMAMAEPRRRSHRDASKQRRSYRVPDSDEDLSGEDEEPKHTKKKASAALKQSQSQSRKRKRSNGKRERGKDSDSTESDEAEYQIEPTPAVALPAMVIEKIMGVRKRKVEAEEKKQLEGNLSALAAIDPKTGEVTEYFVKWKGFSYMHCSWETREILLEIDPTNKQRIKRFHEKDHQQYRVYGGDADERGETEYFNPEYLEIHRLVAHRQDTPMEDDPAFPDAPKDDGKRYLVKWRVLPYTEATWERACDLKDDAALEKYYETLVLPPEEEWEPLPRPSIREYRKLDESPTYGPDKSLLLRPYQLEGLNWLVWNWFNERPSILADEMGLGKTIQTLAFLDVMRFSSNIRCRGPFLIVAPLSLISQWQSECETWTTMNCVVYHGNSDAREIIRDFEFYYLDSTLHPDKKKPFKFNLLVTTYEVAIKDISFLSRIRWRCLIVDEAHRLKNQSSRLVEQLRSIQRDHCVLLTGTPLQNKTEELWALLNFLDGASFPSVSDFLEKFGDLHEAQQVADLHKMLKPYLLRRVKEDVEKSLPPKEETIIEVELTPVQKQWYRAIYEKNTSFLSRGGNPNNVPNLMNVMMELRKCCNHPYLNNGVEERLIEGLHSDAQRHEMMVKCCGKMVLIDKLLPRLKADGHKVLIFSQMVRVLDIIEDYLRYLNLMFERLDGNIRGNDRQAAVDRFVKPEYNRFVMLLSTKAGGLGLNLTAADTVIIFDSDWNPQNDLQAQARAHRIGQTHSVKIYRLITRKTYEMHMFHKASLKLGLDKAVLTHMRRENEDNKEGSKKTKTSKAEEAKEIDELLKRGAYDVFRDDDTEAEQFCAADIDHILERSTQIVQYEQEARSTFSKASFVSNTTSEDVDIDDPDFWKKAVGLTEPDPVEEEIELPRQRKRTQVYRFGDESQNGFDSSDDDDSSVENTKRDRVDREEREERREPRDWTLNGRDRLQRALMHFGFGRWEVIRAQSGGSRTTAEVERFAREFIYVCGLSCAETTASSKDDTPFVRAVVRTSVHAQQVQLIDENEMSSVLKDDDFLLKLRQNGGRRVLIRLDMLWRLMRIVTAACDELDAEYDASVDGKESGKDEDDKSDEDTASEKTARESPPPADALLDDRVAFHGVDQVKCHMKLADLEDRPLWTLITPWWDEDADRSLLIGVFLHGYGRCPQILGDARLRFVEMAQQWSERSGAMDYADAQISSGRKDYESHFVEGTESEDETHSNATYDDDPAKAVEKKESVNAANTDACKMPEVQQMNRLLFWLLSADEIKRQREQELYRRERASMDQQRQNSLERKQRAAALRRIELKAAQLVQLDMMRHLVILQNLRQMPDVAVTSKIRQREWTKEERRTFSYLIALYGAPRILAKTVQTVEQDELVAAGDVPAFAWQTDALSWMNIVKWGRLNKTATMARAYFEDRFLNKCQEIASMKVDPLGCDQRAIALADLIGIEFVDAHEGVLAHGLKARNVAWVTLRRIQLLEDILDIVTDKKRELYAYLRSGSPALVQDMPVWWCPWIHDLGVLYGMAKYGVYGWSRIFHDRSLPFHRRARLQHIRSVFLEGTESFEPLFRYKFESQASMDAWVATVVEYFPSLGVLEHKVHTICRDLLSDQMVDDGQRYEEPLARSEFTMPTPENAFEAWILEKARDEDRVLTNPFVHLVDENDVSSAAGEQPVWGKVSEEARAAKLQALIEESGFSTPRGPDELEDESEPQDKSDDNPEDVSEEKPDEERPDEERPDEKPTEAAKPAQSTPISIQMLVS